MSPVLLLLCGLVATAADGPSPPVDLAAYKAAEARTDRSASAQVKLALWCEFHGLKAERLKHLAIAVLADPANATARGLMGLVDYGGKWSNPEAIAAKVKADSKLSAALAEYNARRAKAPGTADAQWKLALWCEQNGLDAEAKAHLATVVRLEPAREAAWKHLGYHKQKGRWVTDEQLAAEKAGIEAQKAAAKYWRPLLEKWRSGLADKSKARRDEAAAALDAVTDPRAVASVWTVFGTGDAARQLVAARILSHIDSPAASQALAVLSVFGRDNQVRRAAAETLPRRDPRESVDLLVAFLRDRINYKVKPVDDSGSGGEVVLERRDASIRRLYTPPMPQMQPGDVLAFDDQGMPVINRTSRYWTGEEKILWNRTGANAPPRPATGHARTSPDPTPNSAAAPAQTVIAPETGAFRVPVVDGMGRPVPVMPGSRYSFLMSHTEAIPLGQAALDAQGAAREQLASDVAAIDRYNAPIDDLNERTRLVLSRLAGRDMGDRQDAWRAWATDLQGYAPQNPSPGQKPEFVEQVPITFVPQSTPVAPDQPLMARQLHSCFGAGTLVRTLDGLRPIESIAAGDRVLTQDPQTGVLSYQAVLRAFHNPPNETLRVSFGGDGDDVVVTGIHRFWKAGAGWVMARELKPGDKVRALGGTLGVDAVSDDRAQPVFNLEVARGSSFLVGKPGLFVHDNSLVQPVSEPFDAAPDLATATRR